MRRVALALALSVACAASAAELRPAAEFASIADPAQRSAALFGEAGKVLTHPRCLNCHPATDRPTQGEDMHPHQPWVRRGDDGLGAVGLRCGTCHQEANYEPARVPGNPKWQLAPASMAWQGKSLAAICAQIKDPERNGGRSLEEIVHHMAEDELVGWGWDPGDHRTPAPGTQKSFGELIKAWADTGAHCPAG
jgi:hypothetical protein